MLRQRLLFGLLLIAALVGLIWLDSRLTALSSSPFPTNGLITFAILATFVLLGSRELSLLFFKAGHAPRRRWPALVNGALVLIPFLAANNLLTAGLPARQATDHWTVVWLTVALVGTFLLIARRGRTQNAIGDMATTLFSICYLGLLAQYIARIRMEPSAGGPWLLLYFIGVVKFCDMGAYFTGRALGRTKLIEWLSPKKTVEGLLGGIAASVLVALAVPALFPAAAPWPALPRAALFGLFMAVVGQAGDLLESLIKRDADAKDSANAIPAFGGVLDILDSLLLTAPFAYWFLLK